MDKQRPKVKYVLLPERFGGLAGYVKGWWYGMEHVKVKLIDGSVVEVPRKHLKLISEIEHERLKALYMKEHNQ